MVTHQKHSKEMIRRNEKRRPFRNQIRLPRQAMIGKWIIKATQWQRLSLLPQIWMTLTSRSKGVLTTINPRIFHNRDHEKGKLRKGRLHQKYEKFKTNNSIIKWKTWIYNNNLIRIINSL